MPTDDGRSQRTVRVTTHRFDEVDVFASGPFSGNPLAVVHDAQGIDTATMLAIARWTNFSETTFLLPPSDPAADYRVRIFYPAGELPFAGHPTLGTCAAWLAAGGTPHVDDVIVQECGVGLVRVRRRAGGLAFAAPPLVRTGAVDAAERDAVAELFGLGRDEVVDAQWADNGPGWMLFVLERAERVLQLRAPTSTGTTRDGARRNILDVGFVAPHPVSGPADVEVRAFFTDATGAVREDPVTGSLNASAAQVLLGSGRVTAPYVARQGTALGRAGRVEVDVDGDDVWVGGDVTIVVTGTIEI